MIDELDDVDFLHLGWAGALLVYDQQAEQEFEVVMNAILFTKAE